MKALLLALVIVTACAMGPSPAARAADKDTFGLGVFLGDSYAPNHFRLSFGTFDLGYTDTTSLYGGTRVWHGSTYAGFGLGTRGAAYGKVGYEWRFVDWMGLSYEFDGFMTANGEASGRVYIGLVAGW